MGSVKDSLRKCLFDLVGYEPKEREVDRRTERTDEKKEEVRKIER